jgi:hypothetical protein
VDDGAPTGPRSDPAELVQPGERRECAVDGIVPQAEHDELPQASERYLAISHRPWVERPTKRLS